MKTSELVARLKSRFSPPKFATVTEIPNGTGERKSRTCDALAVGCWKNVGIELNGFEVKVSRSDWRNELNQPEKSAAFEAYCHRWWIAADKGVVKKDEMPDGWGLLVPHGTGLKVEKMASLRSAEPMPINMLAGVMRKTLLQSVTSEQLQAEYKRGVTEGAKQSEYWRKRDQETDNKWRKAFEKVFEFQRLTGFDVNHPNEGLIEFGKFQKQQRKRDGCIRQMTDAIRQLENAKTMISQIILSFDEGEAVE